MFNQQQRVAQIAKFVQRSKQPNIVTRVQTDRWLVENIQHSAEATSQLTGQSNSLSFTTGKCGRLSIECQVLQSHIVQKLNAVDDFADQFTCDFSFPPVQFPGLNGIQQDPSG